MVFRTVPAILPRYWAAMVLASVFGANMGDFVSHNLHLGHISGVPFVAAAFILIVVAQRLTRATWEGWYWLAIVTLRTAATNLADLATHDGALGTISVCLVLIVILAAVLAVRRAAAPEGPTTQVPRTDSYYWLAMLTAGTLGTALGDGVADAVSLPVATLLTGLAVAAALALRLRPVLAVAATYWLAIVLIRTFGTNLGDMIAHSLNLATSTPLTGLALLLLLLLWRPKPVPTLTPAFSS